MDENELIKWLGEYRMNLLSLMAQDNYVTGKLDVIKDILSKLSENNIEQETPGFWNLNQLGGEDYVGTYNLPVQYGDLYRKKYPNNLYNVPEEEFKNWCRENNIKLLLIFTKIKEDSYEVNVDNLNFKPKNKEDGKL
tara:strand:- start:29475 stop:29885 length:411 start_codon:yes stop_codon:yes gene_type:complete